MEERRNLAAIKRPLLLGGRRVLDDFFRYADIVVNLRLDILKLCGGDRGRLVRNGRIVVLCVGNDNARSVILHAEVIPDKVVAPLVQILGFDRVRDFQNASDNGDKLRKLAHRLIERICGLEHRLERLVIIAENIVFKEMSANMDKAGILADIRGARRKPKTAIERTHVLEELEILRVDGIYRRQSVHIIKHGIRNRIVINLVLRRELIVKLGGRHIRVRLVL